MTTNEDLLKKYKILSVLGVPFFAVRNDEERSELQVIVRLKLKEVKGLTVIPEPDLSSVEEFMSDVDSEYRRLKEEKKTIKNIFKKFRCFVAYFGLFSYYFVKHLIIRVRINKQICEEEIRMFAETTAEIIEHGREKRIKKLAGID